MNRYFITLASCAWIALNPALAIEYIITPNGSNAAGTQLSQMRWQQVQPGDVITFQGGNYYGPITISLQGTATQPITIRVASGQTAAINGSLSFSGASWLSLEGFVIQNSTQAGIVIRDGSKNVTIRRNSIHDTGLGIWIGAGAGGSHLIEANSIGPNKTHGIAIDRINLTASNPTVIRGNRIFDNLHHGIEINGNRYIIESNEVFRNGAGLPGTSGIHTYAKDDREGTGRYNIIRYNVVWGQKDRSGPDGNGIQLDRWCDYNQVYDNISAENDGAGIHVFHAANNEIYNNTLVRNMRDAAHSHETWLKGDLVVINDRDRPARIDNTRVANNLVSSKYAGVAPLVLDNASAAKTRLENNQLFHELGNTSVRVGTRELTAITQINALSAGSQGNVFEVPSFKVAYPVTAADFTLTKQRTPAVGATLP